MLREVVQAKRQPRTATYEELSALPEHVVGEIIGGELFVQPRPATGHANASSILGALLIPPFRLGKDGPGGWTILDEPELHVGQPREVLVPDLAGWRRERMPELPLAPALQLAPDWVCEVLSPSTAFKDRAKKMPVYGREGVGHVWLIDPVIRSLEVFRLGRSWWELVATHGEDERVAVEPFDALELDLALLWAH